MLNGDQLGAEENVTVHYDLWTLSNKSITNRNHLTERDAYKNATREQKLALELSAAKKERDFYPAKVDQSRALSSIDERLKKKESWQHANDRLRRFQMINGAQKGLAHFPQHYINSWKSFSGSQREMELNTRRIDTSGARSETLNIINGMRYLKLGVKTDVAPLADGRKGNWPPPGVDPSLNLWSEAVARIRVQLMHWRDKQSNCGGGGGISSCVPDMFRFVGLR
ncbi:furry homolog-like protein [Tanacetum coccineum]